MQEDQPLVSRRRPNILITGTPGTGKTSTAASVAVSILCGINLSDRK